MRKAKSRRKKRAATGTRKRHLEFLAKLIGEIDLFLREQRHECDFPTSHRLAIHRSARTVVELFNCALDFSLRDAFGGPVTGKPVAIRSLVGVAISPKDLPNLQAVHLALADAYRDVAEQADQVANAHKQEMRGRPPLRWKDRQTGDILETGKLFDLQFREGLSDRELIRRFAPQDDPRLQETLHGTEKVKEAYLVARLRRLRGKYRVRLTSFSKVSKRSLVLLPSWILPRSPTARTRSPKKNIR